MHKVNQPLNWLLVSLLLSNERGGDIRVRLSHRQKLSSFKGRMIPCSPFAGRSAGASVGKHAVLKGNQWASEPRRILKRLLSIPFLSHQLPAPGRQSALGLLHPSRDEGIKPQHKREEGEDREGQHLCRVLLEWKSIVLC